MEQVFYAAEVRKAAAIGYDTPLRLSAEEKDLACQLVDRKESEEFLPESYTDEVTARVQQRLEEVRGQPHGAFTWVEF